MMLVDRPSFDANASDPGCDLAAMPPATQRVSQAGSRPSRRRWDGRVDDRKELNDMRGLRGEEAGSGEEYHSYVLRVRTRQSGPQETSNPVVLIRVEYVNKRQVSHFNDLSGALDFIAESVRHDVLRTSS